jgi:hypothetical protein
VLTIAGRDGPRNAVPGVPAGEELDAARAPVGFRVVAPGQGAVLALVFVLAQVLAAFPVWAQPAALAAAAVVRDETEPVLFPVAAASCLPAFAQIFALVLLPDWNFQVVPPWRSPVSLP